MAEKQINPWDRRSWPTIGDENETDTYAAVGRALSEWERYETALAILFGTYASPFPSYPARRAYTAVRTFEGRASMLKAASSAYFDALPNEELQSELIQVVKTASCFSQRRNDIAHATVEHFDAWRDYKGLQFEGKGFALYPSITSYSNRDLKAKPSYCMTAHELTYFAEQFIIISGPTIDLQKKIGAVWDEQVALRYIRREPDPA